MLAQEIDQEFQDQIDRIKRSGALGRSPAYAKLLDYLAENTRDGVSCSELSIAIDVFNKADDFDVTSDSAVRVYVYKLRQKLQSYYDGPGGEESVRLVIPKGTYRLVAERIRPDEAAVEQNRPPSSHSRTLLPLGLALLCLALLVYIVIDKTNIQTQVFSAEQQLFWSGIVSDDKPVMIVVGDYYIFGETAVNGEIRLVREFDINSAFDLRQELNQIGDEDALFADPRFDVGLTYLPRGSAYAIARVQEILQGTGKSPRITMMSEFSAEDLRSNHVIYIGYISGLDVLEAYTFAASRFDVGYSYDQLVDTETAERYTSDFIEAEDDRNFVDYGLISSFSVAEDSQIVILAGTRDAGLMEMSDLAIASDILSKMKLEAAENQAFMSVFEVYGFNLTNISASLISSENLDENKLSGG
jgi:hypothetical protein